MNGLAQGRAPEGDCLPIQAEGTRRLTSQSATQCDPRALRTIPTLLKKVVWAAGFELATPCAQIGFRYARKTPRFQGLLSQADARAVLHDLELRGPWRRSAATISSTSRRILNIAQAIFRFAEPTWRTGLRSRKRISRLFPKTCAARAIVSSDTDTLFGSSRRSNCERLV